MQHDAAVASLCLRDSALPQPARIPGCVPCFAPSGCVKGDTIAKRSLEHVLQPPGRMVFATR
ncbi:MAG: hypothetical protein MZV49_18225 [Rhodopseudomonas palustris]|nr:hypothetical protein [Rhodopseudomonas palustris]